jgi:hypothetical protein
MPINKIWMDPKNDHLKIMDLQTNSAVDYSSCAFIYSWRRDTDPVQKFLFCIFFQNRNKEVLKKCPYIHSFKIKQTTAPNFQTPPKLSQVCFLNIKDTNFSNITICIQENKVWNGRHNSFNVILYYELFLSYNEASIANMIHRCIHCFVQLLEGDT